MIGSRIDLTEHSNYPKVSVITVVFNNVEHIRGAIESVLSQDYPNIEYVVVDGGSTDGTREIIERFAEFIAVYRCEPDNGIYDALNKGIALASGAVIGFLHSDDLFADNGVVAAVAARFAESANDVAYGDLVYVRGEDGLRVFRHWTAGVFSRSRLRFGWMPPHPTFYAHRDVYERFGGFDRSLTIAADYDCMLKILRDEDVRCAYIPRVLVKMRVGGVSNRSIRTILRKSSEDLRVIRRHSLWGVWTLLFKNFRKVGQLLR